MNTANSRPVTCNICRKSTTIPTTNPPFGSHLLCARCGSPLVSVTTREHGAPLSVSAEVLFRATGFSGRCLIHPFCPWCDKINNAVVAPAEGRSTSWLAQKEAPNPHSFNLMTRCVHCDREFWIEWDQPPLPLHCSLCRVRIDTSDRAEADPRFCSRCWDRVSRVNKRRKGDAPLGPEVACVLLAGFSRKPAEREVKALRASDSEVGDAPVAELMLSGGAPASPVEAAMITVDLVTSHGARLTGLEVDLKKVSCQMFRNLLVVKIWKAGRGRET